MSSAEISQLAQVISCHAWNADHSMVALCPNDKTIKIYKRQSDGKFNKDEPEWVLGEHDQLVTGIDWAPQSNRLVTCSQDRNAYVWDLTDTDSGQGWKPTLVILRINRAATDVKWSPNEDKFAVASGAKSVSVCYFEEDNDWWVSKHIRKQVDSTILSVSWHPNNILLAIGGTDFSVRVVSGFVKGVDQRPGQTPFGARLPFGEVLQVYPTNGWVHEVQWSDSGNQLCWVSHDSAISFVDVTGGAPGWQMSIKLKGLPFNSLTWVSETSVVAVGHSCNPTLFEVEGDKWVQKRELDAAQEKKAQSTGTRAAFSMFQNKVNTGQDEAAKTLNTKHQNAITCVTTVDPKHVATSGMDGRLIVWTI